MKIGFKVRIYPNKEQEEKLFYFCKCSHEMELDRDINAACNIVARGFC